MGVTSKILDCFGEGFCDCYAPEFLLNNKIGCLYNKTKEWSSKMLFKDRHKNNLESNKRLSWKLRTKSFRRAIKILRFFPSLQMLQQVSHYRSISMLPKTFYLFILTRIRSFLKTLNLKINKISKNPLLNPSPIWSDLEDNKNLKEVPTTHIKSLSPSPEDGSSKIILLTLKSLSNPSSNHLKAQGLIFSSFWPLLNQLWQSKNKINSSNILKGRWLPKFPNMKDKYKTLKWKILNIFVKTKLQI